MAISSKNTKLASARPRIMNCNQAIVVLGTFHHWGSTKVNSSNGGWHGYEIRITHAGRRVTAYRRFWIDAVNAAVNRIYDESPDLPSCLNLVR